MTESPRSRSSSFALSALLIACGGGSPRDPNGDPKADPKPADRGEERVDAHAGHGTAPADTGFDVVVTPAGELKAGERTELVFDPRAGDGKRVAELAIVHEKPFHLLMVSRDLSWFAHEHPEVRADGTLALAFAFPAPGEYVLFGDFTPKGAGGQVARKTLTVPGQAPPARPLVVDDRASAKSFGETTVALAPEKIAANADVFLEFTLARGGRPIDDLRPYLGALGHCVIIGEDTTTFLHSHPQGNDAPGSVVRFHTKFPAAGKYKVWGQFDTGGTMVIADFVLDVAAGGVAEAADPHGAHAH